MILASAALTLMTPAENASACPIKTHPDGVGRKDITVHCPSTDQQSATKAAATNTHIVHSSEPNRRHHAPTYAQIVAKIKKENEQAAQAYKIALAQANDHSKTGECAFTAGGSFTGKNCSPTKPKIIPTPKPPKGAPAPPPIPPEEAAYLAIATKLQINASGIGIGPNPDLSQWKMAVVGHSYWLWANGPTHLGPVSDSASGRTVTLNANLTTVTFTMGDGHTLTCNGPGTPYPGDSKGLYANSPTCSYTYQTTSAHRPGGVYPVRNTTYWSVTYTAPDGSGTIPIVLSTIRDLRVGELQTVIVH